MYKLIKSKNFGNTKMGIFYVRVKFGGKSPVISAQRDSENLGRICIPSLFLPINPTETRQILNTYTEGKLA